MSVGDYLSIAMFIAFILLIFTGFPVAWVLGGLAVLFTAIGIILKIDFGLPVAIDWDYSSLVVDRIWDVMNNWVLVALPMFIFMGLMLDRSGVARRLMTNFSRLFGGVRGGMALSVAFIGILLAASTGIIGASVVLLALLGLPQMEKLNYQPELAVGTVCAVGTLGILIPPSIMLVLMADRLAMPVGDLFLGALFPGLLLGALFVAYIIIYAWFRPEVAPVPADREKINLAILIDVFFAVLASGRFNHHGARFHIFWHRNTNRSCGRRCIWCHCVSMVQQSVESRSFSPRNSGNNKNDCLHICHLFGCNCILSCASWTGGRRANRRIVKRPAFRASRGHYRHIIFHVYSWLLSGLD